MRTKNELWAVGDQVSEIVCWNLESGAINVWNDFPEDYVGGGYPLGRMWEYEDEIMILPRTANMALKLNRNSPQISRYVFQGSFAEGERKSAFYTGTANYRFSQKYGDKIAALSSYDYSLLLHDIHTGDHVVYPCRLSNEDRKKMECLEIDRSIKKGKIIGSCVESKRWSLSIFLDYMAEDIYDNFRRARKNYQRVSGKLEGRCGETIHELIKEQALKQLW